jgi:hypothetical protein
MAFCQVYMLHMLLKILRFGLCRSRLCSADPAYLTYRMLQWQLSHLNGHKLDHCQSESELLYDWWFTANQFILSTSSLSLTTNNFIFQLNTYGYLMLTFFQMRGWVCRLQLLLVILRSESCRIHDHILLS